MHTNFNNQVVLVTGSSSGIGEGTALYFAEQGAKIVLASRNEQANLLLLEKIKAMGAEAIYVQTDVAKTEDVQNMVKQAVDHFGTPFHIYDEKGIRENARRLLKAFAWNPGFKEYFAVKACPNPRLMQILKEEGFGMDCSSLPELLLSERVGVTGEDIMFTSNDTPENEFIKAKELGAVINLDDISHIDFLEDCAGIPELVCFRYNPGALKGGNAIIGNPEDAKYGFTPEQIFEGYARLKELGVKRFGLHTMVASNELNPQYFAETAEILFDLVLAVSAELGITFEFINF